MMQDIAKMIASKVSNIAELEKILAKCDPAAGITVAVRLGAMSEGDDRFPFVTIETSEEREAILRLMIASEKKSLAHWKRSAETYRDELEKSISLS